MHEHGLFIDGDVRPARSGETAPSLNPSTGEAWARFAAAGAADVDDAVAAAKRAFGPWRDRPAAERAAILMQIASRIFERTDELATAEATDAGWTIRAAQMAAVTSAGQSFMYYAEQLQATPEEEAHEESAPVPSRNLIRREPYGVCACITPFNFSLAGAAWKLAPALAAGNSVVLKPSPHTPASALLLAEICREAGVPAGVVNVVTGPAPALGEALVAHRDVAKVHFTGSTAVGQRIAAACAGSLKRLTLELGGKAPYIVLDDANLESAARGAVWGTFFNTGQACIASTRVLVHRSLHDAFIEQALAATRSIRIGDALDPESDLGPLVSSQQLANVERHVADGVAAGGRVLCGGQRPHTAGRGFFFEPTIFTGVRPAERLAREETFGPIMTVTPFDSDEEALALANDTQYGLSGTVWSHDLARARWFAERIAAGTLWINDQSLINIRFPFGGYKLSGLGRELGPWGLAEFQQLKHIHVGQSAGPDEKSYFGILLGHL